MSRVGTALLVRHLRPRCSRQQTVLIKQERITERLTIATSWLPDSPRQTLESLCSPISMGYLVDLDLFGVYYCSLISTPESIRHLIR